MTTQDNSGYEWWPHGWVGGRSNSCSSIKIITHTLYDKLPYDAAGQINLRFFREPLNAGRSLYFPGRPKTETDTNMHLSSVLPQGHAFLAQAISFKFRSGLHLPESEKVVADYQRIQLIEADEDTFWYTAGTSFKLSVLSRIEAQGLVYRARSPDMSPTQRAKMGPIEKAALDLVMMADQMLKNVTNWRARESVWTFPPPGLRIDAAMLFSVRLEWPGPVPMPSGLSGIITAELIGELMTVAY